MLDYGTSIFLQPKQTDLHWPSDGI